jgi:hypothetical protein
MHRHFFYRHFHDTIIISEEGVLPRCQRCRMFCTVTALAGKHIGSKNCWDGERMNQRRFQELQCIRALRQTFHIRDQPLETVANFPYLGRILSIRDNDWAAARSNLQKSII